VFADEFRAVVAQHLGVRPVDSRESTVLVDGVDAVTDRLDDSLVALQVPFPVDVPPVLVGRLLRWPTVVGRPTDDADCLRGVVGSLPPVDPNGTADSRAVGALQGASNRVAAVGAVGAGRPAAVDRVCDSGPVVAEQDGDVLATEFCTVRIRSGPRTRR